MSDEVGFLSESENSRWLASATGQLRVWWCTTCARRLHPICEHCPQCGSGALDEVDVTGKGTVAAYTVTPGGAHHQTRILVVVALDEDSQIRLTVSLDDTRPEQVAVGLPVQVTVEQIERTWVARCRPRPGPRRAVPSPAPAFDNGVPRAPGRRIEHKIEHKVAFTGIGRSPIAPRLPYPSSVLSARASLAAIADAGLRASDIDGVCAFPGSTGLPGVSSGGIRGLEQALRLSPSWHCAGQEGSGAVVNAMLAVASGLCRHVLCFASTSGEDRATEDPPAGTLSSDDQAALAASEYLARYRVSREALGWVAIAARRHAGRNPDALRRTPIDMASYLSADLVALPLGELDRGIACDGAVAVVISAVECAEQCPHQPVLLDAIGSRHSPNQLCDAGLAAYWRVAQQPSGHMWRRATIDRNDVDFIAVNDAFTVDTLCWLEALGFCGPGDAATFVDGARRIGPDGVLPVNPHGGQLTAGSTSLDNLHETVLQLRGHAEGRQIQNARVAVASSGGAKSVSSLLLFTEH